MGIPARRRYPQGCGRIGLLSPIRTQALPCFAHHELGHRPANSQPSQGSCQPSVVQWLVASDNFCVTRCGNGRSIYARPA
jgi:hypothetical protein